jgi:hypothetical protein
LIIEKIFMENYIDLRIVTDEIWVKCVGIVGYFDCYSIVIIGWVRWSWLFLYGLCGWKYWFYWCYGMFECWIFVVYYSM